MKKLLLMLLLLTGMAHAGTSTIVPNYVTNPYTGSVSISANGFFGGNVLVAGNNDNLSVNDISSFNFEVSGDDDFMSFPITIFGYSNKSFHNPFTAENLGQSDRFSDIIITGGPLGYFHQSFTSSDQTPIGFEGFIGSTTPTDPVFSFTAHKSNGTTGKSDLASSEKIMSIGNGFSRFIVWGDSGISVGGKISLDSSGSYPTDSTNWIGTTSNGHNLTINQEDGDTLVFQIAGTQAASMSSNGVFTFAPPAKSSGSISAFNITGAAHTGQSAAANVQDLVLDFSAILQHATSGVSLQNTVGIIPRTYSAVASSIFSSVGTLTLGAPNAGTNAIFSEAWALKLGTATNLGASQASQLYKNLKLEDHQVTITGTTQNTRTDSAFSQIYVGQLSITDASAMIADTASSVYIAGAPLAQGSVTITEANALTIGSGRAKFNGPVSLAMSGTSTLSSGTVTITTPISANSRIFVTMKDANPGAGNLTVGLEVPVASRNVGAGTFAVQANVAAGTINVLDTSTFDWVVFN